MQRKIINKCFMPLPWCLPFQYGEIKVPHHPRSFDTGIPQFEYFLLYLFLRLYGHFRFVNWNHLLSFAYHFAGSEETNSNPSSSSRSFVTTLAESCQCFVSTLLLWKFKGTHNWGIQSWHYIKYPKWHFQLYHQRVSTLPILYHPCMIYLPTWMVDFYGKWR